MKFSQKQIFSFALSLLLSFSSHAVTLNCAWDNSDQTLDTNYFRDNVGLQITIESFELQIKDQGYLSRDYKPCWDERFALCTHRFKHAPEAPFNLSKNTGKHLEADQQWWFTSEITLILDTDYRRLDVGDTTVLTLSGHDGEFTAIENDRFQCRRMQ